jgi:hypothetical protein
MNDAFIALQYKDELADTLYFAGYVNTFSKEIVRGKKAYVSQNGKFDLTIQGRNITIGGTKVRNVREAKRIICERYL